MKKGQWINDKKGFNVWLACSFDYSNRVVLIDTTIKRCTRFGTF